MEKPVYIHAIRSAVPSNRMYQLHVLDYMKKKLGEESERSSFLDAVYKKSAIEYRHSVLRDFSPGDEQGRAPGQTESGASWTLFQEGNVPGTQERNKVFTQASELGGLVLGGTLFQPDIPQEGQPLGQGEFLAGPGAGSLHPNFDRGGITHLVTFSCTGFSAPGFEIYLQQQLGLSEDIQRTHIGFMGCYAAFPALRTARAICVADPEAKVLVLGIEFCTIHFQDDDDRETLVANSLFSDGLAVLLISGNPEDGNSAFELNSLVSRLLPGGENMMAWTLSDTGFKMKLSAYVPRVIESNIESLIDSACRAMGVSVNAVDHWAIHPGGRAILDRVANRLELESSDFPESYSVLNDYGNMSSVSIFFVLSRLHARLSRQRDGDTGAVSKEIIPGEGLFAVAFGPGLTMEAAMMQPLFGKARAEQHEGKQRLYGVDSWKLPVLWPDTRRRMEAPELMDSPVVDRGLLLKTIRQFEFINKMVSGNQRMLRKELFGKISETKELITVLDIGCGGGDILRWIVKTARKSGLQFRCVGIDPDKRILEQTKADCSAFQEIDIRRGSYQDLPRLRKDLGHIDYIISNHVLHHLGTEEAGEFIRLAREHAARGVIINDLRRSRLAYFAYSIFALFLPRPSLAYYDGRLSILKSFTRKELFQAAEGASKGGKNTFTGRIAEKFPFRLLIT